MADRATPNLPSRDLNATCEFYRRIGFVESFHDDGWLILDLGAIQLEFFPFPKLDPGASSFSCCLRIADLDGFYATLLQAGIPEKNTGWPRLHPVVQQPWGQRSGALLDLDCTLLRLIEDAG